MKEKGVLLFTIIKKMFRFLISQLLYLKSTIIIMGFHKHALMKIY